MMMMMMVMMVMMMKKMMMMVMMMMKMMMMVMMIMMMMMVVVVSVEQRPGWTEHVKTMGWVEFRSFEWTARSGFEVVRSLTSINLGYSWSSSIQAKSRGLSAVYQATLCESLLPSPYLELRSLFCSPKCGWHR